MLKNKKILVIGIACFSLLISGIAIFLNQPKQSFQSETNITPRITAVTPQQAAKGTSIIITGEGFDMRKNFIELNDGHLGYVGSPDTQSLMFTVPEKIVVGCQPEDFIDKNRIVCPNRKIQDVMPQTYSLSVITEAGKSNVIEFTVLSE